MRALGQRGIVIAGGQGEYQDKIVRIGHMGFAREGDMREVLDALGSVLGLGAVSV